MIDKDYLKKLKEEDYIAWDSLVNDPMITGIEDDSGCISIMIILIIAIVLIIFFL